MITIIVITNCVQVCPLYHFELVICTTTLVSSLCRKTKLYFKRDAVLRSELYLNFSKSARACNVSFCFDFYLNDTWHVFFSVALSHRGRREHPGNIWFFFSCPFNALCDKLCKNHQTFALHSIFHFFVLKYAQFGQTSQRKPPKNIKCRDCALAMPGSLWHLTFAPRNVK